MNQVKNYSREELLKRIQELEGALQQCQAAKRRLEGHVSFLERHPRIAAGLRGEEIVAKRLRCSRTEGNAPYDVEGSVRIEVKLAHITATKSTRRWTWGQILGRSGSKNYDRLILLGDVDPGSSDKYKDPLCAYVLFDVPFDQIKSFTTDGGTAGLQIRLNCSPFSSRSRSSALYRHYQITEADLEERYGL